MSKIRFSSSVLLLTVTFFVGCAPSTTTDAGKDASANAVTDTPPAMGEDAGDVSLDEAADIAPAPKVPVVVSQEAVAEYERMMKEAEEKVKESTKDSADE